MRAPSLVSLLVLLSAASLGAQERQRSIEVGITLGATVSIPESGESETFFGVPGAGTLLGAPSVYVTFFTSPELMIEPQIHLSYNSISERTTFSGMLQLGYLFKPEAPGSAYAALHGGVYAVSKGGFDSGAVGIGAGYRTLVGRALIVRFEGRFRRWLCAACDLNEVAVVIGLGVDAQ